MIAKNETITLYQTAQHGSLTGSYTDVANFATYGAKSGEAFTGTLASDLEAPCLVVLPDGTLRCYFDAPNRRDGNYWYVDSTGAAGTRWATFTTPTMLTCKSMLKHGTIRRMPMPYSQYADLLALAAASDRALSLSDISISDPPTATQLASALGSPSLVPLGTSYVIPQGSNAYLVTSVGAAWCAVKMTLSV